MPDLMPKIFRRFTVGLTSAVLVATSFGVAGLAASTASAQGLRAGVAPFAIHDAAPETVRMRHAPKAHVGGHGKGWSGRHHYAHPGYGRPGYGRPGHPGYGRPGVRPPAPAWHARWGQPYWRNGGWYYRNNTGAWVAAGVAGLAIGAAAGAAAANSAGSDSAAYCAQRYRSYNPRTGTYTGYDGLQYPCP